MLCDLVKYITSTSDHSAKIEAGGVNLDGKLFSADQPDTLPPDCQPRNVQLITNEKNDIAFAGTWAYLSNMYPSQFIRDNIEFTSSEQAFQFEKARFHNLTHTARQIITNNNPFDCKQTGAEIEHNDAW